jgi:hypothetical protein
MTQPDGWIVHWVGGKCAQAPTEENSKALWRNIQAESLAGIRGEHYIDIPYSFGVDLAGRILEGRGYGFKSGANGSSNYNGHAWAVCILSGPGNTLTQAAIDAVTHLTQDGAARAAAVSYVKGHRDVYATQCPGDEAYSHVGEWTSKLHAPVLTPADWAAIAALAAWEKSVAADPLTFGSTDQRNAVMKQLLAKRGYDVDVNTAVYGSKAAVAVALFKADKQLDNRDGKVCGADCAAALLKP